MHLLTNTSANYNHAADVSVGSRPQVALHALIFNLFGRYLVFAFEQIRRGAYVPNILPKFLAAYYHKFITSISSVNSSEDTLYLFTQRFPIFFQHNAFLSNFKKLHLLNKLRTIGEQGVAEVRQELAQFAQGKTEG